MHAATLEQLLIQLHEFVQFDSKDPPYDATGAFAIFEAIVDNLATHYLDCDFETLTDSPPILSTAQAEFLKRLLHCHEIAGSNKIEERD